MEKKHDLMFCPECGVKLEGDELICSICGYRIVAITQPAPPPPAVAPPPVIPEIPKPVEPIVSDIPVKKHDLSFCPECGAKLDGDEAICSICGYKLAAIPEKQIVTETPVAPPPIVTDNIEPNIPVEPPVISATPVIPEVPVIEQPLAEIVIPPVEVPIIAKHDLAFCPECGQKLEGNEALCPKCLYKLIENTENTPSPAPIPPVIEPTIVAAEKPITEKTEPVEEKPIVKIHDLLFCPECGQKLSGDEVICPNCGYRLSGAPVKPTPPITPPPVIPPVQPPVNTYTPPVTNVYTPPVNQPNYYPPVKKKKTGLIIFLILLFVIVLGGGTVAFLQYNGNMNIPFLESIIPQKGTSSNTPAVADHTRYYVCHSFAAVGTKMTVIISSTIVSKKPYNNKDGAIVQFKKAISKKFPKEYSNFTTVLCDQYKTFPEATSGRTATLKGYDSKKYDIKTVDVNY